VLVVCALPPQGPHFWDECPFPPKPEGCQAGPSADFQAYVNLFSRAADLIRTRPNAITGQHERGGSWLPRDTGAVRASKLAAECQLALTMPCAAPPAGVSRVCLHARAPTPPAGEASSNTFSSANGIYLRGFRGDQPFAAWAGGAGRDATMPALLREAQPYLRLILLLRNPVDRCVCRVVSAAAGGVPPGHAALHLPVRLPT
jgi:hypothetical protein